MRKFGGLYRPSFSNGIGRSTGNLMALSDLSVGVWDEAQFELGKVRLFGDLVLGPCRRASSRVGSSRVVIGDPQAQSSDWSCYASDAT
jgi:hypothetical protein